MIGHSGNADVIICRSGYFSSTSRPMPVDFFDVPFEIVGDLRVHRFRRVGLNETSESGDEENDSYIRIVEF